MHRRPTDYVGVVEHEISEDMGRVSLIDGKPSYYSTLDLFRYSPPGVQSMSPGGTGSAAHFSTNNGSTTLEHVPPALRRLGKGQFVFNELDAASNASVSVSAGWRLRLRRQLHGQSAEHSLRTRDPSIGNLICPPVPNQHATQSYNISARARIGRGRKFWAAIPFGDDRWVGQLFKSGFGTDIANLKSSDTITVDDFSSVNAVDGGHDTAINLGDHDSIVLQGIQLANLHMSNFTVHPPLIGRLETATDPS
jgi:hypothetical protein